MINPPPIREKLFDVNDNLNQVWVKWFTLLTSTVNILSEEESGMIFPPEGIALSTGLAWAESIVDASTNWNTAYTDRLKWDGGSTGLTAATGRASLGLVIGTDVLAPNGSAASLTSFPTFNQNTTGTAAGLTAAYIDWDAGDVNPTLNPSDKGSNITLSNGNLTASNSNGYTLPSVRDTTSKSSGKWYFEVSVSEKAGAVMVGIATISADVSTYLGADDYAWGYHSLAIKSHNNQNSGYGATYTVGDVIGVAFDLDTGSLIFYKNGVSQGEAYSDISGTVFPSLSISGSLGGGASTATINFGATAFTYTPPSGFSGLYSAAGGSAILNKPVFTGTNTGDQNTFLSVAVSGQTSVTAASTTQALTLVAGDNITLTTDNTAKSITIDAAAGGGSMVYPGAGIALSTGSAWDTSITNNSANWNTAYDDRLKWDGGATDLVAATGRTSLGLGTIATQAANNVAITGGSVTGITDITVADGGTGLSAVAAGSILAANSANVLSAVTSTSGTKVLINTAGTITWNDGGAQNALYSIAVAGQTTVTAASAIQELTLVAGSNVTLTTDNTAKSVTITAAAGGGSMVYPSSGLAKSNGSSWEASITDNSANWNTAYSDRLKWDGGATGLVAATGRASLELSIFSAGGVIANSDGIANTALNTIVWRAPFACTVTNVRGYRVGGTGATVNARKNGTSQHLASALSLTLANSWTDGGAVQNTAYVVGDKLEIMVVSTAGTVTQLAIQVEFTR